MPRQPLPSERLEHARRLIEALARGARDGETLNSASVPASTPASTPAPSPALTGIRAEPTRHPCGLGPQTEDLLKQLSSRGLRSLAVRDHTRSELRDKLLRWHQRRVRNARAVAAAEGCQADRDLHQAPDVTPLQVDSLDPAQVLALIDQALDSLTERGWLDEQRAIATRLHAGRARYGSVRIVSDLHRAGAVPPAHAVEDLRAGDEAVARQLLRRRFGGEPPPDLREVARRTRFLLGRGIPSSVAGRLVRLGQAVEAEDGETGPDL